MQADKINLQLSLEDIKLILQSIGHQPYFKVNGLINSIQGQVAAHFNTNEEVNAQADATPSEALVKPMNT